MGVTLHVQDTFWHHASTTHQKEEIGEEEDIFVKRTDFAAVPQPLYHPSGSRFSPMRNIVGRHVASRECVQTALSLAPSVL